MVVACWIVIITGSICVIADMLLIFSDNPIELRVAAIERYNDPLFRVSRLINALINGFVVYILWGLV